MAFFWWRFCEKRCSFHLVSEDPAGDPNWPKLLCPYDGTKLTHMYAPEKKT